ncbi:hypothetical protein HPP92_007323 [Vanilla planifolia]|uniref:Uncharacterized protein n=1 Tax=Vanilla planifolia TaxID=51239 RepID=A0A835RML9_VANPL|nr:hypothetical protein HPP92_007528 [Vanilla planifolia]KAG0490460.1 hypothetical protein HPP92_007323 [Vanilla planifolia]
MLDVRSGDRMLLGDDNGYVETDPNGMDDLGKLVSSPRAVLFSLTFVGNRYRVFDELNGIEVAWESSEAMR